MTDIDTNFMDKILELTVITQESFEEHYIDVILSIRKPHDQAFRMWIEISGSPYNEVIVQGKDGNEAYRVPPLVVRPDLNTALDLASGFAGAKAISETNKVKSNATQEMLVNSIEVSNKPMDEVRGRWTELLSRLGKLPEGQGSMVTGGNDSSVIEEDDPW